MIQRIQRAICFMEEHIYDDITYRDVAKSVHMSSYNFHRSFSSIVGMTANEYLRNRRLTLAALELQSTDISVIDVAYKYGYETPESFSKAFARFHGSTPKQAKRKGAKLRLFYPLVIKLTLEGGSMIEYRLEHRKNQKFLVLARPFLNETGKDDDGHGIPDFWTECYEKNLIEPMKRLVREGNLYGLCSAPENSETHFHYGIGVLIEEETDRAEWEHFLKKGYSIWETKSTDYAVFKCFGTDGSCIDEAWRKFFKEFVPQTGYSQKDETDIELYPENGEKGLFCELWIPIQKD